MSDIRAMLKGMNISQAGHLPVVAEFCRRIGLADAINNAVPTEMAVDVGTVVQFMVLDTLSGRSPLYRLERFARSVDTDLLLGKKIPAEAFNDTEPPRDCRRLQFLRGWSHDEIKKVFPRGARAGSSGGVGERA